MKEKYKRIIFLILGFISLVLAYFGIIMPGVPGIPFILMALFFFSRSSEVLHNWMLKQKLIAKLVAKVNSKKGAIAYKLFVISQLWVSIIVAEYLFVTNIYYGTLLALIGVGFSFVTYFLMSK